MVNSKNDHIEAVRRTKELPSWSSLIWKDISMRVVHALSHAKNPKVLAEDIIKSSISLVGWNMIWAKTSIESVFNGTLKSLEMLRVLLERQSEITLYSIDSSISKILENEWVPYYGILNLDEYIEEVTLENFHSTLRQIKLKLGITGEIYFLEGCIHDGKILWQIEIYTQIQRVLHSRKKESHEYWNYSNILNLLAFKKRILQSLWKSQASISISWGAGNMFSVLGSIESYLSEGNTIASLAWSSMGSAIAVICSIVRNDKEKLSEVMKDILDGFEYDGIFYKNNGLIIGKNIPRLKLFIVKLLEKYGITKNTTFDDLPIPVIINASRMYAWWEQEIFLSWKNKVLESIFASMNIPRSNWWLLWDIRIDSVPLFDHSTNIKGNPLHILRNVGIEDQKIIAFDGGYSSEKLNTIMSIFFRKTCPQSLQWDFLSKLNLERWWWKVINLKSPGIRSLFGYRLSSWLTHEAYLEWRSAYIHSTTSQSSR